MDSITINSIIVVLYLYLCEWTGAGQPRSAIRSARPAGPVPVGSRVAAALARAQEVRPAVRRRAQLRPDQRTHFEHLHFVNARFHSHHNI